MSMDIFETNEGDLVTHHTLQAGHDWQKEETEKHLTLGEIYRIEQIIVHSWHTDVYIEGFEEPFNHVFFENI